MVDKLKIIKLSCGDEIVGKVSKFGLFKTRIRRPMKLFYNYDLEKGTSIMLFPWIGGSDETEQIIKNSNIILSTNLSPMIRDTYNEILNPKKERLKPTFAERIEVAENAIFKHILDSVNFSKKDVQ